MLNLTDELKENILKNALREIPDEKLIHLIDSNLRNLEKGLEGKNRLLFDEYEININRSFEYKRRIAHRVWGGEVDLVLLDKKRNEQIDSRNEQFVSIQKIIECHALLSGTTTIVYLGVDNEQHNIKVIYPFDTFQINTDELIGAIYLDGLIVPVSGDIEKCIKRELELHENDNESYKKVLRFLTSEEYLEMALLLGRVKKAL